MFCKYTFTENSNHASENFLKRYFVEFSVKNNSEMPTKAWVPIDCLIIIIIIIIIYCFLKSL